MNIKVAVLQYDCPEKSKASISKLDEMLSKAVKLGVQLVVAPETAIGDIEEVKQTGIDYFPKLSSLVKKHRVYLATSYYRKDSKGYINQGYIINPSGEPILDYAKIYPAKPEVENIGVVAGKEVSAVDTEIGKLGMLICKDGFNKYSHYLYKKLNELGVDIVCIPTWSIGWKEMNTQEYMKSLYVYGAFASRAFVLMSDCINKMFNSYGRSLIVSPIEGVLKEGSTDKEEILIQELDLDEVKKARRFDSWWQPKAKII